MQDQKKSEFDPWVEKIPWRRAWQPTPVFLPGEPHGQRSVVGYGPKSCKELDTIEVTEHTHTRIDPLRVTCRTRLLGPGHQ